MWILSRLFMSFFTTRMLKLGLIFFVRAICLIIEYILRRVLFLETAVLKVFLGATEENLNLVSGMYLREKNGETASRPVLITRSNSFFERRSALGSIVYMLRLSIDVGLLCAGA